MGEALPLNIAPMVLPQIPDSLPLNVQILSAEPISLPDILSKLTRPVQISGIVVSVEETGEIALRTAAGPVTLLLKEKPDFIKQMITEALSPLKETARPVTLTLQPKEDSPVHIFLTVPKNEEPPLPFKTAAPAGVEKTEVPFVEGKTIKLTVLPQEAEKMLFPVLKNLAELPSKQSEPLASSYGPHGESKQAIPLTPKMESAEKAQTLFQEAPKPAFESKEPLPLFPEAKNEKLARISSPISHEITLKIALVLQEKDSWPSQIAPEQVKATVIGKSPSGHVVLRSEGQTLLVRQEGALPTGTKLLLAPLPLGHADQVVLPFSSEKEMASVRALVAALASAEPQAARTFLQETLPSPTQNLSGTLLFLLSALQMSKLDEWIGARTLAVLEKAQKRQLVDQLTQSLDEASGSVHDAKAGDWKAWPIPLHHAGRFEMLNLYVRDRFSRRERDDDARHEIKKTRFLITMTMSRLGSIQMDGLSQAKQLDLVIRSETPLPPSLPKELRETYIRTLDALGMAGTIIFQTGKQNWVVFEPKKENALMV